MTQAWQYIQLYLPIQLRPLASAAECEQVWRPRGGGSFQLLHSLVQTGTSLLDYTPGPSGYLVHCGWCSQLSLPYSFPPTPSCTETRQLRTWKVLLANMEGREHTQWPDKLDTGIPASCRTSPEAKLTCQAFSVTENLEFTAVAQAFKTPPLAIWSSP